MTATALLIAAVVATPSVPTEFLESPQAFQSRFEVVKRFSLKISSLSSGFTLSGDGTLLYFTEPRGGDVVLLQAVSLQEGVARSVAKVYDRETDGLPYLEWYWLTTIEGHPARLVVGAGSNAGSCAERLFILDLRTMGRLPLDLSAPPAGGEGPVHQLRTCGEFLVSPSTRYLATCLWQFSLKHVEDEAYVTIFSLTTGQREYVFHVPTREEQDEVDLLGTGVRTKRVYQVPIRFDFSWAGKDLLLIRPREPDQGKDLVLERSGSGEWLPTTQSPAPVVPKWTTIAKSQNEQIFVHDSKGVRWGFSRNLLFDSRPAVVLEATYQDRVVVLRQVPGEGNNTLDLVVLRWRPEPATK